MFTLILVQIISKILLGPTISSRRTQLDSVDVSHIPLPNQEPPRPSLSQFDYNVLQSQAVSELVSQNEDLMARLTVNLKRNSDLEGKLATEIHKLKDSDRKQQLLSDQILILKEKNRILSEKQSDFIKQISELQSKANAEDQDFKTKISALENQVFSLQSSEGNIKKVLHSVQESFEKRLNIYLRYHKRIQKYIAPSLINLKSQLLQLIDDSEELKNEWYDQRAILETKISVLTRYHQRIKNKVHPNLKEALTSFKHLQTDHTLLLQSHLSTTLRNDELQGLIKSQKELLQSQMEQIQDQKDTIQAKDFEINNLQKRIDAYQTQFKEHEYAIVELQNKVIESQRRFADRDQLKDTELHDLQERLSTTKQICADQTIEISNSKEKIIILEEHLKIEKSKTDKLESENHSLRSLWNDHRLKLDELRIQESASRALNQELMDKLKQERESADQAREQILLIESNYQKRVEDLSQQIAYLSKKQTPNESSELIDIEQIDRFAKMDALLSEIQTGFTKKKPVN